jgi:alpha-tubulin suppressor-like RCC1 family protein
MTRIRILGLASLSLVLASCDDPPVTEALESTEPAFAPGGVPGPPPWVVIPTPRGPKFPVPRPPHAGPPAFLTNIVDVGAGGHFSCALRSDGAVFCWGINHRGQLGDGTQVPSSVPVEVSSHVFDQLFVGDVNACGLTSVGEAWCWGDNSLSQLGAGVSNIDFSREPVPVAGDHRFTQLSIGLRTTCGVAMDGLTYCWGSNQLGLLGNGTTGGESEVPVAVSNSGSLNFVTVTVGFLHACALDSAGATYCWGSTTLFGNGATGPVITIPTPAAGGAVFARIGAGIFYTCGLNTIGSASCWGSSNTSGEMGLGSFAAPVLSPTAVAGGLQFSSVDAHNNNSVIAMTCGVTTSNEAWCWGSNDQGQLGAASSETCTFQGLGNYACSSTPLRVSGGVSFTSLAVGLNHVCAVSSGGIAYCWGDNSGGQLGDGTMVDSSAPVEVSGLKAEREIGSIVVTPFAPQLTLLGSTQQFTAQALDQDGVPLSPQPAFSWSSSAPAVAPVDAAGVATALTDGSTVIRATAADGSFGRAILAVAIIDPVRAFAQAWVGDGGVNSDGVVVLGGLLADEWQHSGTFITRNAVDRRTVSPDNATIAQAYNRLAIARTALEFEAARLQNVSPSDPRIGQMLTLAGFTYLAFAEHFCSGVPLDDPNVGLSTADLLALASTRFAQALAGPIDATYTNGARVGSARARLDVDDPAAAALAAAAVPTGFALNTAHSSNPGEGNGVFLLNTQHERVTLAHIDGGNGLPFRSTDPRVPWTRTEGGTDIGFNGVTPQFDLLKYTTVSSPVQLAGGVEARLIEAEALLRSGNVPGFLAGLNALRGIAGLPILSDPGSNAARADVLFQERAFWLFATGHRLGDVRRLIAQYGRLESSVLPVGAFAFGGTYGTDANLPVPLSARGPGFTACTIRDR